MILTIVLLSLSAFKINSPEIKTYNSTEIELDISHNETLQNITYILDGELYLACENCYSFTDYLTLDTGNHSIEAFGILGNKTYYDSVDFYIEQYQDFSFEVISPIAKTYTSTVELYVTADKTLDHIRYELDGNSVLACENCDEYQTDLELEEGDHELTVFGAINDSVKIRTIDFKLDFSGYFTIWINSPEPRSYDTNSIDIDVETSTTLDEIAVHIGPYKSFCNYCSSFTDQVILKSGSHILVVRGTLNGIIRDEVLHFSIEGDGFALGFEKLPKAVEADEINDEDLAAIIRENQLNPGILNRLIKTRKLGPKSLEAIIDTQFKPVGLWRKILSYIGFEPDTYASMIYEKYDLPPNIEKKLLSRDDLPNKYVNKIKEKLRKETQEKGQKKEKPEKSLPVGKQDKQDIPKENERPSKPEKNKVTAKASKKNVKSKKS